MIEIFKSVNGKITPSDYEEKNIWISLTNPTIEEINQIRDRYLIEEDFLKAALDTEEVSRLEQEEDQTLILINASQRTTTDDFELSYTTIPTAIIIANDILITVTIEKINSLEAFKKNPKMRVNVGKRTRFTMQIIYEMTAQYLLDLRKIDKYTDDIETKLYKNMKNDYLFNLLALEKNLTYFITALRTNEQVINRVIRYKVLEIFEDDEDLIDDVIIGLKQAQEMATINSKVIRSIRDAFSAIISNNLNSVMKILASFTIILTIPTMIYSFFGMNTNLGLFSSSSHGTIIILGFSLIISIILYFVMKKKNMF